MSFPLDVNDNQNTGDKLKIVAKTVDLISPQPSRWPSLFTLVGEVGREALYSMMSSFQAKIVYETNTCELFINEARIFGVFAFPIPMFE